MRLVLGSDQLRRDGYVTQNDYRLICNCCSRHAGAGHRLGPRRLWRRVRPWRGAWWEGGASAGRPSAVAADSVQLRSEAAADSVQLRSEAAADSVQLRSEA